MRQSGILCPCFLILIISTSALAQEIVKYSIYDEFGDIMLNSPGSLTQNGKAGLTVDQELYDENTDFSQFRYRTDTYESAYEQGREAMTTYRNKRNKTDQVWKFRPLEDEKEKAKKIIKIDEKEIRPFRSRSFYPPQTQPPVMMMPGMLYPIHPY